MDQLALQTTAYSNKINMITNYNWCVFWIKIDNGKWIIWYGCFYYIAVLDCWIFWGICEHFWTFLRHFRTSLYNFRHIYVDIFWTFEHLLPSLPPLKKSDYVIYGWVPNWIWSRISQTRTNFGSRSHRHSRTSSSANLKKIINLLIH